VINIIHASNIIAEAKMIGRFKLITIIKPAIKGGMA
jgi:hypothetical protein